MPNNQQKEEVKSNHSHFEKPCYDPMCGNNATFDKPNMQNKADKMLETIAHLAYQLTKYTILASLEPDEKKRDKYIEKIIEFNEKIEEQYSTNWH